MSEMDTRIQLIYLYLLTPVITMEIDNNGKLFRVYKKRTVKEAIAEFSVPGVCKIGNQMFSMGAAGDLLKEYVI